MTGLRLVLGIEAATPACSVALADAEQGTLLAQAWRERSGPASPLLLNDVDRLLGELGAGREAVAAVAVTRGPGAFTGLRVGLALAKGLAQGLGCPLYAFSTLAMLARRWPVRGVVAALLDARRHEVYAGLFRIDPTQEPELLMPECVAPLEQVLERMEAAALDAQEIMLLGGGAIKYREAIDQRWGNRAGWAPAALALPAAEAAALAACAALRGGVPGSDPLCVEPVYLRASDAALRHPHGVPTPAMGGTR